MKKGLLIGLSIVGAVVIVLLILVIWGVGVYNNLVTLNEAVNQSWSQVENQYQRRADLIPNLVNTVKGYAAHEKETLEGVIEARSKATAVHVDADKLTPQTLQQFTQAQDGLSSALSRLMVVVERYPKLKSDQNFSQLQAQLDRLFRDMYLRRMNVPDIEARIVHDVDCGDSKLCRLV